MMIEVDLTKPFVEQIQVQRVSGKVFKQKVHFEWKPLFCFKCNQLGHRCEGRETQLVYKLIPKHPLTLHLVEPNP